MGTVFDLIADTALRAEDPTYYTECQVCSRPLPVYPCQGRLILESGATDPDDQDLDVYVACAECIKAGRIAHIDEYYFDDYIRKHASDPEVAIALLRRTPRLPKCLQDTDWPFCCGVPTEYTGEPTPEEARILDSTGHYWQFGLSRFDTPTAELVPSDILSVLGGVSAFRCSKCQAGYWIFQFT